MLLNLQQKSDASKYGEQIFFFARLCNQNLIPLELYVNFKLSLKLT